MGKTSKWWRSLLSSKQSPPNSSSSAPSKEKKKSKWAISKTTDHNKLYNINEVLSGSPYSEGVDANKHAIAVAAATAAVAEAALAAARAAAEVVRLTSGGGSGRNVPAYISRDRRRVAAAVKIQSAFRAYLAKRALRALKGLVKLQALVRGHIVRKQSSDILRRMQAMARIQARASAHRSYVSESCNTNIKFFNSRHQGGLNPKKYDHRSNHAISPMSNIAKNKSSDTASNWLDHWMEQSTWNNTRLVTSPDDNKSDKILEIDTWKPRQTAKNTGKMLSTKLHKPNPSISSGEMSSIRSSPNFPSEWTAEISPRMHSASPFTPTRSECSRSLFGDYIGGHPSYMANTESSRAKVRSLSTPKQRMRLEKSNGLWELEARSEKGYDLHSNHRSNTYVHLGRGLNSSYGY